jgi:diguanylate cyclase (GGDEF)-like protein
LGHQAGDEVLIGTVRRIERCMRPADTLARLGGDEFAILLDDIRTDADAARVADRIREELATPLVIRGRNILASVSIGIALSSAGYESGEEMLRDADTAMYKAKAAGRVRDGEEPLARRPT